MHELSLSDTDALQTAFSHFPSGVAALCAVVDGEKVGLVATSFTVGVSFDPPLVLFSVQNESRTWPILRRASRIGVSILADRHEDVCMQLASRTRDRFAGVSISTSADAVFVDDSVMWLDCEINAEMDAGDHKLVVLAIRAMSHADGVEPLIYHGRAFRRLLAHNAAA